MHLSQWEWGCGLILLVLLSDFVTSNENENCPHFRYVGDKRVQKWEPFLGPTWARHVNLVANLHKANMKTIYSVHLYLKPHPTHKCWLGFGIVGK